MQQSLPVSNSRFGFIYMMSVMFLIAIPGSALVAIKTLLMVILFISVIVMHILTNSSKRSLLHLLFWTIFILIWTTVGVANNDETNALREGAAYLSFLIFAYCFIVGLQWVRMNALLRVVALSALGYGAIKFGILLAVLLGMINPETFYWWLKEAAGGVVMSGFWGGGLPRITMANDYLLPLILLLLLMGYLTNKIKGALFVVTALAVLMLVAVTLSRYLYVFTAVVIMLFFGLHMLKRKAAKFGSAVLAVIIIVIPSIIIQMGYSDRLISRFTGSDAASSDSVKSSQAGPIIRMIDSSKAFGHGFGLSMQDAGRGNKQTFQAELQWIALTAKIGLIGLFIMLAGLIYYTAHLIVWNKVNQRVSIIIGLTWGLWLVAGFYNPVMLLTTTALNYLFFYMISVINSSE